MTDKTATQNLTRTTATDDPRKMATYLQTLATEADRRMAAHFRDLDRLTNPPLAVLRLTAPTQIDVVTASPEKPSPDAVPFDSVEIDTAGQVDLSVSRYVINFTETGWWWVGGYAYFTDFFPGSNADPTVRVQANGSSGPNFYDPRHAAGGGSYVGAGGSMSVRITDVAASLPAFLHIFNNGSSTTNLTTVAFAELWALKVRDL